MTPFLRFRTWLRRGPNGERVPAAIAAALAFVLLVWIAIPVDDDQVDVSADGASASASPTGAMPSGSATQAGAPGTPTGDTSSTDAAVPVPTDPGDPSRPTGTDDEPGTGEGGPSPADAPAVEGDRAAECGGLRATDQGVTAEEIFVAVPVLNLAGEAGNETFGVRGNVAEVAQAAVAGVNESGGVACRRLRIKVYKVNPLDQNNQRAVCLEIVAAKPFAVIDYGGYISPAARSCFVQAKLPYQGNVASNADEVAGAQPFMYSLLPTTDDSLRAWVFEAAARGSFESAKGFGKLGLLLDECNPKANDELKQNLAKVGVPAGSTVAFTMTGCSALASPNEVAQAVLQHRNRGASHVFLGSNASNSQNYVRQADGIGWKPTYMVSDYGSLTNSTQESGWPDGFDGSIGITSNRTGERNSGIEHPALTQCNDWMKRSGVRPSEEEGDGTPPYVCDQLRLFAAAADATGPGLTRTTLLGGLAKVGTFQGARSVGAYAPGDVTGGDFVRAIAWHADCTCWKVIDPEMKPARTG